MAGKSVNFNTNCDLVDSEFESLAKWLSCNGEIWGVGPTAVFASAAALFLYHELEATIFIAGDQAHVSMLEKTLVSTMVLGMLALMIHLWVCSMRFFQYYLDTLIKDSPSMLLEITTAGLLGGQAEMVPLGPLTRFLRQQQPQIHITVCWFLSLCYADYVRKHYCQRFNMPYLEQWQAELHDRASRGVTRTMDKVNSFVGAVHQRLRGYGPTTMPIPTDVHTKQQLEKVSVEAKLLTRVRAAHRTQQVELPARSRGGAGEGATVPWQRKTAKNSVSGSSVSPAKQLLTRLRNSAPISPQLDVRVAVHRSPASATLAIPFLRRQRSLEEFPWRRMETLPFDKNY